MQLTNYWSGFRDELVATSLVLVVAMGGSFFIVHQLLAPPEMDSPEQSATHENGDVLGSTGEEMKSPPTIVVTGAATIPVVSPTINDFLTTILFGVGGEYEGDSYKIEVINPRLEFDARTNLSRKFLVDIRLTNKSVAGGLFPTFTAAIMKDGVVIVPAAALSVSPQGLVLPGQTTAFTARLSLIEGTDIHEISYKPGGDLPNVSHALNP